MNDATTTQPENILEAILAAAGEHFETCGECQVTVYADDIVLGANGSTVVCPHCAAAQALVILASGEPVLR